VPLKGRLRHLVRKYDPVDPVRTRDVDTPDGDLVEFLNTRARRLAGTPKEPHDDRAGQHEGEPLKHTNLPHETVKTIRCL
jgi:hypothetical protein